MSDAHNPNIKARETPQWGLLQREMFWAPNEGRHPPLNTSPDKLKKLAEERLSEAGWLYSSCNAGQSWTHYANRMAFYRHQIIPRTLVDTNSRDTVTTLFGQRMSAPVGFAPIGINRIYHPTGELSPAKVAAELNIPYCLSSAGSYSIEETAKANGNGPRYFQLYWSPDDKVATSMLERAHKAGYSACILTTDTWQLGWRHDDVAMGNYAFYHEHGAGDLGLNDPAFLQRVKEAGLDPAKNPKEVGAKWIDENIWHGHARTWDELPGLIKQWKRISGGKPFCIKGIQNVADARKAVEMGVDGIIVSNHAGRQVDGAIGSLDALEKVVKAVGDKTVIMFDSGVRGAADIFKALALGAKFVFVGRLWVWALGAAGEEGVRHVMKSLLAEFDILMNVSGYASIDAIDREAIDSLPRGTYFPANPDLT
ncbi:FMN-dependent dehydrogenase [Microdochium trichocladiopsis]|uniref:FMN-dependent dehydrogenase n=1 Tax=Microdochium trichocladiopsis TaxID=1682393 RepID=A0A9P8Y703_9PEZI|nr:FMN-dependent dehydrogenase [Microdochium trichocladiopsis]KAH7031466.1 FMN-dependent dehydrogenase [Microdochium trichocladiopsis]